MVEIRSFRSGDEQALYDICLRTGDGGSDASGKYLDEIADPQALGLRSFVNGEVRQDSNTSDMLFGVAELVHDLSQYLVFEPGDLLNTGTPQGVALSGRFSYLAVDDVMELEIDGLGRQRQVIAKA